MGLAGLGCDGTYVDSVSNNHLFPNSIAYNIRIKYFAVILLSHHHNDTPHGTPKPA